MAATCTYNLDAFPQHVTLLDTTKIELRPMQAGDADALLAFFRALPQDELFSMKEDVTSEAVIHRWMEDIDYDRALPLLAFTDGQVVADAALMRSRSAARRHVGEMRIIVHPRYKSLGLGTLMMHQLMMIANDGGIELLTFEGVSGKQDEAIHSAQWLGFTQVAVLRGRVKGRLGQHYDVIVMEALLGKWFDWWPFRVSISRVNVRFPW